MGKRDKFLYENLRDINSEYLTSVSSNLSVEYFGTKYNNRRCAKKEEVGKKKRKPEKFNKHRSIMDKNQGLVCEQSSKEYKVNNYKITSWEPNDYKQQISTVWRFPERGSWATHNGKYRGNWSPYVPRNIILRYSREGDTILDQFVGSGTTLIEAKLLNRKGIGFDINPNAVGLTLQNIQSCIKGKGHTEVQIGDARNLKLLDNESIDLICTHPPYANIIKYSDNIKEDISRSDVKDFLNHMDKVATECFRVLKDGKFCAILIGDTRKNGCIIPLGFNVMEIFIKNKFILKEIIIKEQYNCSSTEYWTKKSLNYNFLLIAHEYLFVFRKP